MKRPNQKHKRFLDSILKANDADKLEHKLMMLPQVSHAVINGGWTTYASFKFYDGKTFRTSWSVFSEEPLKNVFKEMLKYMRNERRGVK